jgi:predicted ester cyclase
MVPKPADTTRRLLEDQIVRLWGEGRTELVAANYAPDVIDHMPVPGQPEGLEGMAQVVRDFRSGLPDMAMTLHGTIVNGDHGCDFWTLRATNTGPLFARPATGRAIEISGIDMIRTRGGRIAELWHVEEMLQMGAQLGHAADAPDASPGSDTPACADGPAPDTWTPDPATLTEPGRRNLAIARAHIEQVRATGSHHVAHRLYAPDVVDRNPAPGQGPGIGGMLGSFGRMHEAVPDLHVTIGNILVENALAAARWTMTGIHTGAPLMGMSPRRRPIRIHGMDVIHVRDDGLIDWVFHVAELAQLRAQIA